MPFKDPEKLKAWRASPEFKAKNYARVKAWRSRPEKRVNRAEEARRWREKHKELSLAIQRRHFEANADKIRARQAAQGRKRRVEDPESQRLRNAVVKARRDRKLEEKAGRPKPDFCDICNGNEFRIVFDHCHAKGHFRGWICDRCNKVLGLVRDDVELLKGLSEYLRLP